MDMLRQMDRGVMRLTINRPAKANTLSAALRDIFVAALADAERDDAVRAVLLDAAPGANFSGGVDLRNPQQLPPVQLAAYRADIIFDMTLAQLSLTKPFLVSVGGRAIGGGCIASLLADRIVASPRASFSMPEVRLGMASFLAADLARHRLGDALARQMVLFGEAMTAAELAAAGALALAPDDVALGACTEQHVAQLVELPLRTFRDLKAWTQAPLRQTLLGAMERTRARNALASTHLDSAVAIKPRD